MIFDKSDKRRLYQLMNMYLSDIISTKVFCDEFYYSYDLEIDSSDLTNLEKVEFAELSIVSDRFSEFEEDHRKYPKGFFTEKELRQKTMETLEKLKEQGLKECNDQN